MFRRIFCGALALIVTISLVGCTTMRIQSNKDPNYSLKIYRLAVVENMGESYDSSFNSHLVQLLKGCGVEAVPVSSASAKNGKIPMKFSDQKNADAILTVNWTMKASWNNRDYELTLWDPQGKKVWKSLVDFVIGNVTMTDRGELLAYDIVDQMNKDGLFVANCQLPPAP